MKILAGARIAGADCTLVRSRLHFGGFLREALSAELPSDAFDWGDFRRGGEPVKLAMLSAAAARLDLVGGPDSFATGVLGWNGAGCGEENARFWRDCRANGGTGRGGLFVGTLHSIPVCEAAIALGLHGAAGYLAGEDWARTAEDFLGAYALAGLLMLEISVGKADALWLAPGEAATAAYPTFGACCDDLAKNGIPG